jgi:hypothetical protein
MYRFERFGKGDVMSYKTREFGLWIMAAYVLLAAVPSLFPKNRKDVPVAPLPAIISSAKNFGALQN